MRTRTAKITGLIALLALIALAGCAPGSADEPSDGDIRVPPHADIGPGPAVDQPSEDVGLLHYYSRYWPIYNDLGHGFRYAVPCYWRVVFPDVAAYDQGSGVSYSLYNYPEDYPLNFPSAEGIFEAGGIKIDLEIINLSFYEDLPPGVTLIGFLAYEHSDRLHQDSPSQVIDTEEVTINGQPGIFATVLYNESGTTGQFYLFAIDQETLLRFSVFPPEAYENRDVQVVLNSLALQPETDVQMPYQTPGDPPQGLTAPCIGLDE
jgi:hypothetical protein